jgi:hypothetical protein
VRELIAVETRLNADGELLPQSFYWSGRRVRVFNHGRRWERDGQLHFLVQDDRQGTYELAFDPSEACWSLLRAPQDFGPADHFPKFM